jgi:predicted dehydrogenase
LALKALLIGCGNIGALYDLKDPERTWTHAKAFSRAKGIDFEVADTDKKALKNISKRYNVSAVHITDDFDFSLFHIVSITSPTPTHFGYLKRLLKQNIPVVICEKPVAVLPGELKALLKLYDRSTSKVLVNYIRRFQPAYAVLRDRIASILKEDSCTGIVVKYQRGFLNNGSHAFDLLEFVFGIPFSFESIRVQSSRFDSFAFDPTITAQCSYGGIPVNICGIINAAYPVFEIELFFKNVKLWYVTVVTRSGIIHPPKRAGRLQKMPN